MTDRLLLVRHGVTTWNREGRFQGHLDPPLDPIGVEQARLLGARLAAEEHGPLRIVTSPLTRASATAELLADAFGRTGRAISVWVRPDHSPWPISISPSWVSTSNARPVRPKASASSSAVAEARVRGEVTIRSGP